MLNGYAAVQKAPIVDGLTSVFDSGIRPAGAGVGGCHIVEAHAIAPQVLMPDNALNHAGDFEGCLF